MVPTPAGYEYAILLIMTDTPESKIEPSSTGPSRLGQVTAWVLIIAGVVFVVAVIFFSGLFLGWSSGAHHGWHRGYDGGREGTWPMMGSGGMMGPGGMGGMMGPGGMVGPGGPMGPQQTPTTSLPATPHP